MTVNQTNYAASVAPDAASEEWFIVRALVQAIKRADTWQDMSDIAHAIVNVQIRAKQMREEAWKNSQIGEMAQSQKTIIEKNMKADALQHGIFVR